MPTIAQAVIAFKGGDPGPLIKAAKEQGARAGQEGGGAFAGSFASGAARVGFGALSTVLGIATKGLLDTGSAMAKYRAETNATAADTAKAQAAVLAANRTQRQSIGELADGLAALRTEMGLDQDQANALLVPMAKFAEVSGQTIPDAVRGMDNILDAYNLTAADAVKVQDALVVAHQNGAGSITEIQASLAKMAPQLTAANMDWKDGTALLVAFGAAGLDAAAAPRALNTALSKVKSPEELQRLVADIQATTDDFERARKAADLFGTRAGPQMASLLRPGGQSLADFRAQVEKSGGAVDAFADHLHDDLVYKVQQGLKDATGAIVQFAAPAGPILTGLGALVTGVKAIGLDKVLGNLWTKAAASPMIAGAAAAAGSLAGSAYGVAVGVGEWLSNAVLGLWGRIRGNPRILASAAAAGTEAGTAMGAAAGVAGGVAGGATGAASSGASKLGKLFGGLFAVVAVAEIADAIKPGLNDLAKQTHDAIFGKRGPFDDVGDWLSDLPWPLGPKGAPDWAGGSAEARAAAEKVGKATTAGLVAGTKGDGSNWLDGVIGSVKAAWNATVDAASAGRTAVATSTNGVGADFGAMVTGVSGEAANLDEALKAPWSDWRAATSAAITGGGAELHAFVKLMVSDVATLPPIFQANGAETLKAMADGIASARQAPLDAFDALKKALKTPLTETAETARLAGELASKELAAGLKSGDPELRAEARAVKQAILDRLAELEPDSGTVSKKAMAALTKAMHSADPDIAAAATAIVARVTAKTGALPAKLHDHGVSAATDFGGGLGVGRVKTVEPGAAAIYTKVETKLNISDAIARGWGAGVGNAYGAGLAGTAGHIEAQASLAVAGARSVFETHSPPGPKSPLHEIDKWGKATGLAWVGPFIDALETAAGGSALTLAKVKSEFTKAVAAYPGVGASFGSVTPEAQTADLQRYIANLTRSLATEIDPAKRLETYRQIAEYQARIVELSDNTATAEQKAAQTLIGYINVLDKALLTETDPKRRQEMQAEIETYIGRINTLLAAKPEPITAPDAATVQENALKLQQLDLEHQRALLAATPELEKANAAQLATIDAQLAQIANQLDEIDYQRQYNALLLEGLNLQRQAAGLAPLSALPAGTGAPAGPVAPPNLSDPRLNASGASAGYYTQDSPGVWTWHSGTAPAGLTSAGTIGDPYGVNASGNSLNPGAANYADPRDPGHVGLYLNDGSLNPNSGIAPAAPRDPMYGTTINVYNPAPEPASTSVRTRLQRTAAGI